MRTTLRSREADVAVALVAAAHPFRDSWMPVSGSIPSGFVVDATLDYDIVLDAVAGASAEPVGAVDLRTILADPAIEALTVANDSYPGRLAKLHGRPAMIFVEGTLPDEAQPSVAIVGSRQASRQGTAAAHALAHGLSERGVAVISGLAEGIDAAAHEGALDGRSPTVAVMGTGLGTVFPKSHRKLADRIVAQGALVSQFPPGYGPTKTTFPARNALIAGLSDLSVIVEMSERSGTRIEANCAIAQGKRVLLWEPILGDQPWAREFVTHPAVRFAASIEDIVATLERLDEEAGTD